MTMLTDKDRKTFDRITKITYDEALKDEEFKDTLMRLKGMTDREIFTFITE
jgi:hypothetical protein